MPVIPTQIINNGASLKIISADGTRNVMKQQIREISVINTTIVKIDIGQGALNNIFIVHAEVSSPVTSSPEVLMDAVNAMLQNTFPGVATEPNQQQEISELQKIKTSLLFQDPQISDESNAKAIYHGYAVAGALPSDPVWAIQKIVNKNSIISYLWASGNRNFDKIWDNRATLVYQ